MARAWGLDRDASNNGTTPLEIQRIFAAQYINDGIIDGANVTGTATMSYSVSAGAVVLSTGTDLAVIVAVPATTVSTTAAPSTGSRTDTIYVNLDSQVLLTTGTQPANTVLLAKYTVSAGTSATSSAASVGNRKYAVPVGASLGRLWYFNGTPSGALNNTTASAARGAGTFYVPTDRDIRIKMDSTIYACTSTGTIDTAGSGGVIYRFYLDGQLVRSVERTYNRAYETKPMDFIKAVTAGNHTVHYTTERSYVGSGAGYYRTAKGGADQHLGDEFTVWDIGVIQW